MHMYFSNSDGFINYTQTEWWTNEHVNCLNKKPLTFVFHTAFYIYNLQTVCASIVWTGAVKHSEKQTQWKQTHLIDLSTEPLKWRLTLRQMQESMLHYTMHVILAQYSQKNQVLLIMTLCVLTLRTFTSFYGPNVISYSLTNGLSIRQYRIVNILLLFTSV